MKKEFDKFREYGFVIEGSCTWSAPSFAINKKDGGYRIVTNFRYHNLQIVPFMFPLPLISDLKMVVANKTNFSKFDVVKAVVGNNRAAARCRSVRRSLPGRIIFQVNVLNHFCNVRSNYFRTCYEKERIIVQLLSHLRIVKNGVMSVTIA